jgi:hypothetical protein
MDGKGFEMPARDVSPMIPTPRNSSRLALPSFIAGPRSAAAFVIALTISLWGVPAAAAQQVGTLTVRVVDQTGGALPNATIVVERENGAAGPAVTPILTDEVGVYTASGVNAGKYVLTVSADAFVTARKNVDVRANRVNEVRVVLLVRHAEMVKVPGLPIKMPNSLTGMTFSGEALARLPNGEVDMLARLMELAGTRGRPGDVAIYVDGFRDYRRLPPKAAIDLITINADPYSTEFAEPGTRRIEILTKPGADGLFGHFKGDFNDESLNARDPLSSGKPQLQRRTFSGYFSAPIIKQKWGFYVYAGRWEEDENANIRATTLDDAFEPTQFSQTLSAPLRNTNLTLNTGFALGAGNRVKAEYSRDASASDNLGLESGFALPDRGYSTDTVTHAARFSLLSVWGSSAVYELRVQAKRLEANTRAIGTGTAIVVLDAFSSGANQNALQKDVTEDSVQVDTKLTKGVGSHTLRLGVQADNMRVSQFDSANFGGTFTFGADVDRDLTGAPVIGADGTTTSISPLERYRRTLLGLPGYRPTQFVIAQGNPLARVRQWNVNAFLQDDWIQSANLTVSAGVRAEAQSNISSRIDVAPRVGITWAIGSRGGTIRTGSGLFYTRVDPDLTLDTIRLDGQRQQQYVIPAPAFFPMVELSQDAELQTIMTKAGGLRTGRLWVSNFGYERPLFGPLFASATYTYERGDRLTRLIDLNAPEFPAGTRPIPGVGQVLQYQSTGESERREVQVGVRADFKAGSHVLLNYTFSETRSNTDGPGTLPADARNLDAEWGRAANDERDRLFLSGTIMLPSYWMLIPSVIYSSPRPFNITTGLDNNLDGHFTDRPSFASPDNVSAIATPFGLLNPTPLPGETIIPRNFGRRSRLFRVDLSLAKVFVLQDPNVGQRTLSFYVNAKNLLNTVSYGEYNGVLLSQDFGLPNTAQKGRQVSFGIGFSF